jgi:hypothetical protein
MENTSSLGGYRSYQGGRHRWVTCCCKSRRILGMFPRLRPLGSGGPFTAHGGHSDGEIEPGADEQA